MEDFNARLIPYEDKSDLTQRIADLLDWEIGNSYLKSMLMYPGCGNLADYFPCDELSDLMKYLSQEHEIIQEIIQQAKVNLEGIIEKTRDKLKIRTPKYLNSFESVGGSGRYESLFNLVQRAAYHVIDLDILTDDNPPKEGRIVQAATNGVTGYSESHPKEVKNFLEHAWEKRLTLPFIVTGYWNLSDERAIDIYFEIFRAAKGKDDFVMNGIQRGFGFKFIGRRLKRKFTNHDFKEHYQDIKDNNLRNQLDSIFA